MVYVLDIEGKPLMPTERHGKVRRLLRDGKAHVVKLMPFTIQLDYESRRYTQEVCLGIDAGSVHIGVSATTEKRELFTAEVLMRTDIVSKIANRRELRKSRRCRKTRYRVVRFENRRNAKGKLVPSIRYKVDCHLKVIYLLHSILPISKTIIEVAQFDVNKLKNDKIQGVEYQQGEQKGYRNVREYVLARDGHKCQLCKGKSGDKVLNVHHLESRLTGGNAPDNLITLCKTCHNAYHIGIIELNIKRGKVMRDAETMNIMRKSIYSQAKDIFKNVSLTYGYITKEARIENHIEKSHSADAYCISGNLGAKRSKSTLRMLCVERHQRSLHRQKVERKGMRRCVIAPHWLENTKLQKYDIVEWKGIEGIIFGSSNGRPVIRNLDRTLVTPTTFVNAKAVRFIKRKKNGMIISSF